MVAFELGEIGTQPHFPLAAAPLLPHLLRKLGEVVEALSKEVLEHQAENQEPLRPNAPIALTHEKELGELWGGVASHVVKVTIGEANLIAAGEVIRRFEGVEGGKELQEKLRRKAKQVRSGTGAPWRCDWPSEDISPPWTP